VLDSDSGYGFDNALIAIILVGMLFFCFFRLDAVFAAPRQPKQVRRPPV
jgi:hypothetical protein